MQAGSLIVKELAGPPAAAGGPERRHDNPLLVVTDTAPAEYRYVHRSRMHVRTTARAVTRWSIKNERGPALSLT